MNLGALRIVQVVNDLGVWIVFRVETKIGGRLPAADSKLSLKPQAETKETSSPFIGSAPEPRAEEPSGLERVFQEHHQQVFRTAYRITGNASDAEDVLQTVFMRLLSRKGLWEGLNDPGSYLRRAAVNASLDLLRTRSRSAALTDALTEQINLIGSGPEEQQEARELREWLRRALAAVSPMAAEIFVLRYLEGYDNAEIARMIDTSAGTVAVVLHRTRSRLRNEILSFSGGKL